MRRSPTTLVLGAGSSCAFGFPTGEGLRKLIIGCRDRTDVCQHIGYGQASVRRFIDAFAESQLNSIDAFLGREVDEPEVGKRLIAYLLLVQEGRAKVFDNVDDHWYRYMHNEIVNPVSKWEDLDLTWLSIVTFNYERSLEHFLATSLSRTYKKNAQEVAEKLRELQIVHVYGQLGNLLHRDQTHAPFGGIPEDHMDAYVLRGAQGIRVVPEGRIDSPGFEAAQKLLKAAKAIYFLGFGFDKLNIERLGAPDVFLVERGRPKAVHATVLGMTPAEVDLACKRVLGAREDVRNMKKFTMNANCLSLLRECLPFTVE